MRVLQGKESLEIITQFLRQVARSRTYVLDSGISLTLSSKILGFYRLVRKVFSRSNARG